MIPPVGVDLLEEEIEGLSGKELLLDLGEQRVFAAEAGRIPHVLLEIGRLRELSFRAVGEGTGREADLDSFDEHYTHLFLWHCVRREVVGAYRLGPVAEIISRRGVEGLYTSSLFRFAPQLLDKLAPALELGRSFVRPEYQKSFASLMLLWKGIGRFVLENPSFSTLFGPVSISADYASASQHLITVFLQENNYAHPWSRWVRPRVAFRPRRFSGAGVDLRHLRTVDDVSSLISEIEGDRKGVPILLRQYLKLGGQLLGFNVDRDFSDVLDVLILVDLPKTEPRILARYMGQEAAQTFLSRVRSGPGEAVSSTSLSPP